MTFQPLHVRAYIQTPIISDRCLPLDGILFNHFVRDRLGPKTHTLPREVTISDDLVMGLPFEKQNDGTDEWYYACSFARFQEGAKRGKHEYAKRFDFDLAIDRVDFKGKRRRVETSRGEFKNYWVKEYTWNCLSVDWFCRADRAELERLLPFCTHVGKKSSQGCGSVLRWEVKETTMDWHTWADDGSLMRAVPCETGPIVYGIRPSYWLPKNQKNVLMPG